MRYIGGDRKRERGRGKQRGGREGKAEGREGKGGRRRGEGGEGKGGREGEGNVKNSYIRKGNGATTTRLIHVYIGPK